MIYFAKLNEKAIEPKRAFPTDSGLDLHCIEDFALLIGERKLIKTGIAIELPLGYEAQIRSRSGLALKQGVCVLNGIGTIDQQYRGEIGVILCNLGHETAVFKSGDRIAQLVIARIELHDLIEKDALNGSARGFGGFGSTGE